jgi:hypothetical protein
MGLNPEPGQSYGLATRFFCSKCGKPPEIVSAEGRDPIVVKLRCHGELHQGSYAKSELIFTQYIFEEDEGAS